MSEKISTLGLAGTLTGSEESEVLQSGLNKRVSKATEKNFYRQSLPDPTNPQDADTKAARDAAITAAISALKDGVPSDGDTLNKLRNLITSLGEFAGDHDASSGNLPATGTGIAGAIDKGDYWYITIAGTIAGLGTLAVGDVLFSRISGANEASEFFYLPFASLVADATESTKGKAELADQTESEDAASNGTVGSIDHTRIITPRGWRWAWDKAKTLAQVFTSSLKAKQIAGDYGVLTDAANIAWDANSIGNIAQVTLGGNRTLDAITNPLTGAIYIIRVVQDGTGGRTLAFNGAYTFPNGISPVLNSIAAGVTVYKFFYDGANFRYTLPNGSSRFLDAYLETQKAASTKKNALLIDDTGKVTKVSWVEHDTTNQKITIKGVDDSNSTVLMDFQNLSGDSILKLYNGLIAVVGGTSSMIEVDSAVTSNNALVRVNSNQAKAWKLLDRADNEFFLIRTTTGDLAWVWEKTQEYDYGVGFKKIHKQAQIVTTTTAGSWNNLVSISLADGEAVDIHVSHMSAWATDGTIISGYGAMNGAVKRSGATTSAQVPAFTVAGATNEAWRIAADDTNDAATIDFKNTDATGKTFTVMIDYTYIKRTLPA